MRGTVAKRLRKAVYGEDHSPRHREYQQVNIRRYKTRIKTEDEKAGWVERGFRVIQEKVNEFFFTFHTATVISDKRRMKYQNLKKNFHVLRIPFRVQRKRFFKPLRRAA